MAREVAKREEKAPRLATTEGLPAFLDEDEFRQDAGKGISTSQRDKQVPMLRVLQSGSPQVKRANPLYIDGAMEGQILMRGAPRPLIEEFVFQPCFFTKHVVEWIPRDQGGGFVARHQFLPEDDEEISKVARRLGARRAEDNEFKYVLPNGHELIETRYHVGHVLLDADITIPFVVPFSGSGHSVSRQWMQQLALHQRKVASFGTLWSMKTRSARNSKGEWYVLDPKFLGLIDRAPLDFPVDRLALYNAGKALYESMASGEKEIEQDEAETTAEDLGGAANI